MSNRPFVRVRLMLDKCTESWKVAPCAAAGATPCYKTRCTCQDPDNYNPAESTLALCGAHQAVPPSIQAFPCITDIEHVPTKIDLKGGLGRRDEVMVSYDDFQDGSELTDPYWTRRAARRSASFTACMKRRNKHHAGRTMYMDEGEIDDAGRVVEATLTTRRYVIERWDGPSSGRGKIIAKDVLWRLETAQVPAPSVGELVANVTAVATSFSLKSGEGAAYGTAPFTIKVDEEIMTIGARTTDAFSSVTRGAWGTTAAAHDIDSKVQLCKTWTAQTVDTIWADILDDAGIAAALADTTAAATEAAVWFSGYLLTACISEPTKAADLIADLTQQVGAFTWWDATAQLVKLKGIHPMEAGDTPSAVNDDAHVIGKSVTIRDDDASRISRVDCYYGIRDWSQSLTDPANYLRRVLAIDASAETAAEYDEVRDTRKLFAYFCPTTLKTEVEALTARVLDRYRDAPRFVTVDITVDDVTEVAGGLMALTVRELVDDDGAAKATTCWVLGVARQGSDDVVYRYELLVDQDQTSIARWWFFNYDACPVYDSATDEDKLCAFFADDTTEQVGSDAPYSII